MNILDIIEKKEVSKNLPLAELRKPRTLEDFIGQEEIIGKHSPLYNMILHDRLRSMILYGPSGSGKTSIARIISNMSKSKFIIVNAVSSGIGDMKEAIKQAGENLQSGHRTVLFIDEIHRFNKAQQDFLLPFVENATIILIGATTENPYFEINPALLSRCILFTLKTLEKKDIITILNNAVQEKERGLGDFVSDISQEAIEWIANLSGGDARNALNMLEIISLSKTPDSDGKISIGVEDVKHYAFERKMRYDKNADEHYHVISAFIKSIRGSDENAALHYLARMLEGGEDIMFICRRLVILASEDIGNANPTAAVMASSIAQSVHLVGMPEARILLSQLVIYLAKSKKSNACYLAINQAIHDVKTKDCGDIPNHLKDASYKSAKKLGHGIGYKYPHDYENHWVKQQYMPDKLSGTIYYKERI